MYKILSINPGSTSTKIAVYEDEKELFTKSILHTDEELKGFDKITDQYNFRKNVIENFLVENNFELSELSAIVGRGGVLPPVESGAYEVNDAMVDVLKNRPVVEHASNLAAIIAYDMAQKLKIKAYIYDAVAVDELVNVARLTGIAGIERKSLFHALNTRAASFKVAEKLGKKIENTRFITAHLGGGISIVAYAKGKAIDIVSDDEGPFSPERCGKVAVKDIMKLAQSGKYTSKELKKMVRGEAGLKGLLGTIDAREVEKRIGNGDEKAKLVYETMAYQVGKGIGEMAIALGGDIDAIILTGGIAYSEMFTTLVSSNISFLGKVIIMPGENEMQSLTLGTLRVLRGEEEAKQFTE